MKANQEKDYASLFEAAIRQLATRERSAFELTQKLNTLSDDRDLIRRVIEQLQENNLQSDERFCEVYVRSYQRKGHGPVKIRANLSAKGVSEHLIQQYLIVQVDDWHTQMLRQFNKKYQPADFFDFSRKAKIYRFFQGKGFTFEQVRQLESLVCQ